MAESEEDLADCRIEEETEETTIQNEVEQEEDEDDTAMKEAIRKKLQEIRSKPYIPAWLAQTNAALNKFEQKFNSYSVLRNDLDQRFQKYNENVRQQEELVRRRETRIGKQQQLSYNLLYSFNLQSMSTLALLLGPNPVSAALRLSSVSKKIKTKFRGALLETGGFLYLGPYSHALKGSAESQGQTFSTAVQQYFRSFSLFKKTFAIYRKSGFQRHFVNNSLIKDINCSLRFIVQIAWMVREQGRNFPLFKQFYDFLVEERVLEALQSLSSSSNTLIGKEAFLALVAITGVDSRCNRRLKQLQSALQFIKNSKVPLQDRLLLMANQFMLEEIRCYQPDVKPFFLRHCHPTLLCWNQSLPKLLPIRLILLYNRYSGSVVCFEDISEEWQEGGVTLTSGRPRCQFWLELEGASFRLRLLLDEQTRVLAGSRQSLLGCDDNLSLLCWILGEG